MPVSFRYDESETNIHNHARNIVTIFFVSEKTEHKKRNGEAKHIPFIIQLFFEICLLPQLKTQKNKPVSSLCLWLTRNNCTMPMAF